MRNLLVTGGAGFIGSNFVHYMLEKYADYRIVVFDKLTYAGRLENLDRVSANPRFAFIQGDICDLDAVRAAIQQHNIDTIVNFAAETHVDRSIMTPDAVVRTNVNGTWALLEAARAESWSASTRSAPTGCIARFPPAALGRRPAAQPYRPARPARSTWCTPTM